MDKNAEDPFQAPVCSGGLRLNGSFTRRSAPGKPLVSVITVVRNGRAFLERTIQSVLDQTYDNIEYIIIDGGSTDGTLDVIRQYEHRLAYWASERDNGISDAFNKGIKASTGDLVTLLNCDDWFSPDQIERGAAALRDPSVEYVFGDLIFHDGSGKILYRINGDPDYARIIHSKMPEICHPTVLARRSAYDRIGLFDLRFRYAMDYEWLLRLHVHGGKGLYVPGIVGYMGIGGASDLLFFRAVREVRDISRLYGQNAVRAEILYRLRIVKGTVRRLVERLTPDWFAGLARRLINPRYSIKR